MFKKKRYLILVFISFILINTSYGTYIDHYFCDEGGDSITNVRAIGWRCDPRNKKDCDNIERVYPFTTESLPLSSGDSNQLTIYFPLDVNDGDWYIWYVYRENYMVKARRGQIYSSNVPFLWSTEYCTDSTWSTLEKTNNCKAEFTPNIQSCAEVGIPLSILTDTQLDAYTESALDVLIAGEPVYFPSELDAWREVETTMNIDVKPQGSSSSVSGFPTSDTTDIYTLAQHTTSNSYGRHLRIHRRGLIL